MRHPYFTTKAIEQREDAIETVQTEVNAFIQKAMEARSALTGKRILVVA